MEVFSKKKLSERSRVVRDEKLILLGIGGRVKTESSQSDNCNSDKEGSLFISCSQSEAWLRFAELKSRCCS